MPPKKAPAKPEAIKKQDIVDEAPLQAVVLADSYNRRFEVLCLDRPRILLPLCSTPLLAWTLEALSLSKVKQVFLFCGVHSELIRRYVESSPYRRLMDIRCLSSQTARTPGDALRELDAMGVLNGDNPFILVHSPLVSNFDLSKMVDAHKKLRSKDPNYIMTMGVGKGGRRHPESPIMLVHPPSRRLLHYHLHPLQPSTSRVAFPSHLFVDPYPPTIDTYEIWSGTSGTASGYRDLGIDICEADVPALCTENFDYHDLRRHFVNGVLTSELLGKKIAVHLVGEEQSVGIGESKDKDGRSGRGGRYVERIRDTRTYADVSRDVMRRWAFPITPDLFCPGLHEDERDGGAYELRLGNVYIAKEDVNLSQTADIHGPSLIGPHTSLGDNTVIYQSTLGAAATVGSGSKISRSYIFDNVRIGRNCDLEECIIGENVTIEDGVRVQKGALIGDGVKLAKGIEVPRFMRVGRGLFKGVEWQEGDDEPEETLKDRADRLEILTAQSTGFIWPSEETEEREDSDDESDIEDPYEDPRNKKLLQLGRSLSNFSNRSFESISSLSKASSAPDSPMSFASDFSDDEDGAMHASLHGIASLSLGPGSSAAFRAEAQSTLQRAWEEQHAVKNLEVEFGLLVPAFNAGVDAARREVIDFFLSRVDTSAGAAGVLKSATSIFTKWGPIIGKYSTSEKTTVVFDFQRVCVEDEEEKGMAAWFGILLRAGYESDLLDEGTLVRWRDMNGAKESEEKGVDPVKWEEVWKRGKVYVDVLESMESDEDDDDDDDEDEDGDEESEEESD